MEELKLHKNPLEQFKIWYAEAQSADIKLPESACLATANKKAYPSARIVLYKGILRGGFKIFTNFESKKGKDLLENPNASLVFYWSQLDRQVRIEGGVEKLSREEVEIYFSTRPRGSQIGAWASHQSQKISSRDDLVHSFQKYEEKFQDQEVTCPPYWGGFLLIPNRIEFWVSRENRLHDRFSYFKDGEKWLVERLAP